MAYIAPAVGVIVLNSSYEYLNTVTWKKAVKLIHLGKVEIVKSTKRVVSNFEDTVKMVVPKIVRLLKYVRAVFKRAVPFSKRNIHVRDDNTCQYCGSKDKICIDHINPKAKGGKSTWENCVSSCKTCNNKKRDRTPREAGMFLARQPFQPTINEYMNIKLKAHGLDINKLLEELK